MNLFLYLTKSKCSCEKSVSLLRFGMFAELGVSSLLKLFVL